MIWLSILLIGQHLQSDETNKLIKAIMFGDYLQCKSALENGAVPLERIGKYNGIELAVNMGDERIILSTVLDCKEEFRAPSLQFALKYSIDHDLSKSVKVFSRIGGWQSVRLYGMSPLSYSIVKKSDRCVSYLSLVQNNFVKNVDDGRTPIHLAAISGIEQLRKLNITSISLSLQDNSGNTPLHYAARYHLESAKYLLMRGASPNIKNRVGCKPGDDIEDNRTRVKYARLLRSIRVLRELSPARS